ncbi:excinuclease ABC subunit UvrB [Patescibacteria group bacterium]
MMKFKLESQFKPTGDQPTAIEALLKKPEKFQTLLGVTGSGKTFTMANVIQALQKPTLVLAHNKTLAAQLAAEFREFFPHNAVNYFVSYYDYYQPESYVPRQDLYIAKEATINEEIDRLRHAATMSLLTRQDVIIVASVSCIYGLGSKKEYTDKKLVLKKGEKISRAEILRKLIAIDYKRNDIDFHRGTFRVRGDVVDIFPAYEEENIIRLDMFGDEIEKISVVNGLTGKAVGAAPGGRPGERKTSRERGGHTGPPLQSITIFPNTHYVVPGESLDRMISEIKADLKTRLKELHSANKLVEAQRLEQRTKYDLEMLQNVGMVSGIENYSRYLDNRKPGEPPQVLIDYFPKDYLMIVDESHMTIPQVRGMYLGDQARKQNLVDFGFRLPSAKDNRPLKFSEFEKQYNQVIFTSATPQDYELKKSHGQVVEQIIRPTGLLDPEIEIKPTKNQVDDLLEQIQARIKAKQRVLVTTLTKRMSEDLTKYLRELKIKVQYIHSDVDTLERLEILRDLRTGKYDVLVGINLLREGLDLPEVTLVAILDADKEGFLRSDTALIQVMGRAARHVDGHVIMYADRKTGSMKRAIAETTRRRIIQQAYNQKHGITPQSIQKKISDSRLAGKKLKASKKPDLHDIPPEEIERLIKDLQAKMDIAAKNQAFEDAAKLRDQIEELKKISR